MSKKAILGKRIKMRYVGIYYRYSERRVLTNGKPDKCYDIHYKKGTIYTFEKVGWVSEGFSLEDAIELRKIRVRTQRHPELVQSQEQGNGKTINDIWEVYKEKWFPNLKRPQKVVSMYELYIGPVFGNKFANSITTLDIQTFKNDLLNTTRKKEPYTKLKSSTVTMILKFFKALFAKGHLWGFIESPNNDPFEKIDLKNSDTKRERFLKPNEAEKLLEACQYVDCNIYYVALLSLYTGMRLGEILTLTGQQIDLESGTISLNGKTGRRVAYLPEDIKTVIEKLLPSDPSGYLFFTRSGNPMKSTSFSAIFSGIVATVGLNKGVTDDTQKVVFHTLRHTFCSWLAIDGVPLYTIGQLVGHSSPDMTQRYAKLSPDCKREALKHIGKKLRNN